MDSHGLGWLFARALPLNASFSSAACHRKLKALLCLSGKCDTVFLFFYFNPLRRGGRWSGWSWVYWWVARSPHSRNGGGGGCGGCMGRGHARQEARRGGTCLSGAGPGAAMRTLLRHSSRAACDTNREAGYWTFPLGEGLWVKERASLLGH